MNRYQFSLAISLIALGVSPSSFAGGNDKLDQLFPYYTLECSLTQGQPIGSPAYGNLGHALMYIKGACRDTSVSYPKIKMCDDGTDLTKASSGVALSADKALKNTRYLVTDGQDMMFNGALKAGEPVNDQAIARTRDAIVASGALNSVEVHDQYIAKKQLTEADRALTNAQYIAKIGADTDYAILFARTARCAMIPMTRAQIQAEVNKANELNVKLVTGEEENDWNGLAKNCANFTHNVLAAAGIRESVHESHKILVQAFNLLTMRFQVPANETLRTAQASHDLGKIKIAEDVYNNKKSYKEFMEFGALPESGGLFSVYEMNIQGNTKYNKKDAAQMLDIPFFKPRAKALACAAGDEAYQDLSASITAVRDQMLEVQAARNPIGANEPSDYVTFATKYNKWIDDSIVDLNAKLKIIAE